MQRKISINRSNLYHDLKAIPTDGLLFYINRILFLISGYQYINMKKISFLLMAFFLVGSAYSQTCDQRVEKLLSAVGSFSASTFYNTYATIGSIGDGYGHDAYDGETVNNLLDAQIKLMDNLVNVFRSLLSESIVKNQTDIDYADQSITLLQGLKKQAQLMEEYVNSRKNNKLDEYQVQRKKNWATISKMMGLDE
jgi:hypothetical protein